jgi:hypothetical protein
LSEIRRRNVPVLAIAGIALLGVCTRAAEANSDPGHRLPTPAEKQKIGGLLVGVSSARVAQIPESVHHGATIRNPQRHITPEEWAAERVSPAELKAWSKVNKCEEGGDWHVRGSQYSGGLGISNYNWDHYRPRDFPANAADATPAEQIVVAERIQPDPPDQQGCNRAGW